MKRAPWVLIAGGFHRNGGMDKANLALAEYLLGNGYQVHLVSHSVATHLTDHPLASVYLVRRPFQRFAFGDLVLNVRGQAVARRIKSEHPDARVVTNGGNCRYGDINWVHYVHKAAGRIDSGAPFSYRVKEEIVRKFAVIAERRALKPATIVLANSERTRRDLIAVGYADPAVIHTVYLGAEADWTLPSELERETSRRDLGCNDGSPIVAFIGALNFDNRKGVDTLIAAWRCLCRETSWDANLLIAGAGNGLVHWKKRVFMDGLSKRIRFLGFTNTIRDLLAAVDLLVSPVRYESYGLNVQEAVCRGVPVIVSASAGIAERFPRSAQTMLLKDPEDILELITRLKMWRSNMGLWKEHFKSFGESLRTYCWQDMARQITNMMSEDTDSNSNHASKALRPR